MILSLIGERERGNDLSGATRAGSSGKLRGDDAEHMQHDDRRKSGEQDVYRSGVEMVMHASNLLW